MKRKIIIEIVILLAITFICLIRGNNKIWNAEPKETNSTKNVDPSVVKEIDVSNKSIIAGDTMVDVMADFKCALDKDTYKEKSMDIFLGEVKNVEFITFEGVPWSKLTVSIEKIYKGDRRIEDEVIVYELGGYIEYDDFKKDFWECEIENPENTLVKMNYFQPELHEKGDESVFFVINSGSRQPFEQGSYELICSSFSEFRYDEREKKYCERKENHKEKYYSEEKNKKEYYSKKEIGALFENGEQ